MKKLLCLFLALIMAFAVVGCGTEETEKPSVAKDNDEISDDSNK